jgi:Flp pilus assembly protein CpaB
MEGSSSTRRRTGSGLGTAMFSTRRGAITTAVVAALLAAVLLFAFVQSYKKGSSATAVNAPVFVASGYIPKGTPVSVIASAQLLSRTTVPASKAVVGAITDPSVIRGEVAASTIYPGQQLTSSDFTATNVTVASLLTGNQRAIAIPVDSAHGLVGIVQTGDHVDVLVDGASAAGGKGVATVDQNILVLAAPGSGGGGGIAGGGSSSSGNIILRVTNAQAPALAYAADNQKVWITLRPALDVGALTPSQGTSH